MLGRSRFWKNVLALTPDVTERKLPRKSLLQIIPSESVRTSKAQLPQTASLELFPINRVHWPPVFDLNVSLTMGSLEQSSDFAFKPVSLKEFESVFPQLVEDLAQHSKQYGLPEEALQWYKDV